MGYTTVKGQRRTVEEFKKTMLNDIAKGQDDPIPGQVKALMDYIDELHSVREDDFEAMFIHDMLDRSASYINSSSNDKEKYQRMVGICRLIISIITPDMDSQDDDYITGRYEGLKKDLENVERVGSPVSSCFARLNHIYDGLMELALALGFTDADDIYI